jgi:hypothetical protein
MTVLDQTIEPGLAERVFRFLKPAFKSEFLQMQPQARRR